MEEKIKSILHNIHIELDRDYRNYSLIGGAAGISLYQFLYYKHFRDCEFEDSYLDSLNQLFESTSTIQYPAFAGGKSGLNWYFSFLFKNGILEGGDFQLLTSDDDELALAAIDLLKRDYYDPLHGAIGIARQLLYGKGEAYAPFFHQVFEQLDRIFAKGGGMFRHYDADSRMLDSQKTNLGLSHGITGILKFCLECYSKNICTDQAHLYAGKIVQFLLSNPLKSKALSYFCSIQDSSLVEQTPSRLAWCYGDLGIGYVLFQAGKILGNDSTRNFALEVLHHSTSRKKFEDSRVMDAGFCHGSAGIAYIYKKLWHQTNDIAFSEACDFWIGQTIEYSKYPDGITGFKAYRGTTSSLQNEPGLLEGVAGIGLVLLSYLTGDCDWDHCLMVNE